MSQGRSLATGQLLDPKDISIDRVFIIECWLNWAKKDMKEFKTSSDFTGWSMAFECCEMHSRNSLKGAGHADRGIKHAMCFNCFSYQG